MEPLILYFVLFFPGVFASSAAGGLAREIAQTEVIPFSLFRELGRTLTYTVPSLALLWYLISGKLPKIDIKMPTKKDFLPVEGVKPVVKDLYPFVIGLPALIIIGLGVSVLVYFFSKYSGLRAPPQIEGPVNAAGWIVLFFSCLGTGYLEESYFRYYLLTKLESAVPQTAVRIAFSTILFSACHIYEGPWGILNAVLAGVLLSVLFIRFKSLHGIAWAHGAYNMFVYVMGNLN